MENVANDFYEDDEPLHEVLAAFNSAPKGLTGLPLAAAVHELWQVTVTQAVEQTPRSGVRRVESFGPVLQHAPA